MRFFLYFIFFILGACIISFLKVIAYDYPQLNVTRRSHCDHCNRILRWFEIIPIIGYFIVNGRCISCKKQINFWNPLQELCGGLWFLLIVYQQDYDWIFLFIMLVLLGFMDQFYGYIYPIFYLILLPAIWIDHLSLNYLVAIVVYFSLLLISRRWPLGLGDIEVMALLGLIIGLTKLLDIILVACLICLVAYFGKQKRSFRFIPYLTVATGIIYLIFSFRT